MNQKLFLKMLFSISIQNILTAGTLYCNHPKNKTPQRTEHNSITMSKLQPYFQAESFQYFDERLVQAASTLFELLVLRE